jgi:hypothetical protein
VYTDDKESNSGLEAEAEVVTDCWEFAAEAEVKVEVVGLAGRSRAVLRSVRMVLKPSVTLEEEGLEYEPGMECVARVGNTKLTGEGSMRSSGNRERAGDSSREGS